MVLSIIIYISTNNIKSMTDIGVGPRFFPKLAAIIMFILSTILLIQEITKWIKKKGKGSVSESKVDSIKSSLFKKQHLNAFFTMFIFILYIYFITKIGFLISSVMYLFIHFFVLGERKSWNVILFIILALVVSTVVFYTFRLGFSVRLPTL